MEIEGKVALVTGGASGLGRAAAEALVGAGARVALVDLPSSRGAETAAEIGGGASFVPADVRSEDEVRAAIDEAVSSFGGLHVAVSCAGVAIAQRVVGRGGPHSLDHFRLVVEVNLIGTFNVLRLAAAAMREQEPAGEERGVIINTSSIAAWDGQVGQTAYASSKGGVASLTLPVARDLARDRIRCVAIAPGTFDTPMLAGLPPEAIDRLVEDIPHPHRLGKPEEFGALVRHIVENSMLNGTVIRLDGALRMR